MICKMKIGYFVGHFPIGLLRLIFDRTNFALKTNRWRKGLLEARIVSFTTKLQSHLNCLKHKDNHKRWILL